LFYGTASQITGGRKQSDEGAALFAILVNALLDEAVIAENKIVVIG